MSPEEPQDASPNGGLDTTFVRPFTFAGFHGAEATCDLELVRLADGRTLCVAYEREDNPGTSVTNAAEHLASAVCDRFGVEPRRLVWVEHYAYPSPSSAIPLRTWDLVTWGEIRGTANAGPPDTEGSDLDAALEAAGAVVVRQPAGYDGYFRRPAWRPMRPADWRELGLEPRPNGP